MQCDYGLLNILKPSGPTSADMVSRIKRITGCKKTGHMGTLDPLAAGVLVVALGKAAKLFNLLNTYRKTYRAVFTFGRETDTGDSDGKIVASGGYIPSQNQVTAALADFTGEIMQRPHRFSAVKLSGEKAYDLARKGIEFDIDAKAVHVYEYRLINFDGTCDFTFDITVSSGTYIRSLCVDLAHKLGTYAYLSTLIRTSAGPFCINEAATIQQLEYNCRKYIQLPENVLGLDKVHIDKSRYRALDNGVSISCAMVNAKNLAVYCDNTFFGIGDVNDNLLTLRIRLKD